MNLNQIQIRLTRMALKLRQRTPAVRTHLSRHLRKSLEKAQYRLGQVPKWINFTVAIFIASEAVLYAAVFVDWVFPKWANKQVDLFLCPNYSYLMYSTWYVKELSDRLSRVIFWYGCSRMASRLSDYFFLVSVVFLCFRIFDFIMFFWNFSHYTLIYLDMFYTALVMIWTIFKGYKPSTVARIKSIF